MFAHTSLVDWFKRIMWLKCAKKKKKWKDNEHNSLQLTLKVHSAIFFFFCLGIYLSFLEAHVFLKLHSKKTVHFLEQIMTKDKYPNTLFIYVLLLEIRQLSFN